jgi:hypothetical protein
MNVALIWGPCIFLGFFSLFDVCMRNRSRYGDIPWSFLNISKALVVIALIGLSVADLVIMLMAGEETTIYNVQIVSVAVKIVTFVSN